MTPLKIIGLTGNIGSGKSTVSVIFQKLGIPVYHADLETRKLYDLPDVKEQVIRLFGKVYQDNGKLNTRLLASIVFADPEKIQMLNDLLHPMVRKDFRNWCRLQEEQTYVIQEAAIIFESGFRNEFDKIIHVSCPPETAYKRVMLRDSVERDIVVQRSRFQMDEKEKAALSDYIILNDGFHLVIPQVLAIHRQILEIPA